MVLPIEATTLRRPLAAVAARARSCSAPEAWSWTIRVFTVVVSAGVNASVIRSPT